MYGRLQCKAGSLVVYSETFLYLSTTFMIKIPPKNKHMARIRGTSSSWAVCEIWTYILVSLFLIACVSQGLRKAQPSASESNMIVVSYTGVPALEIVQLPFMDLGSIFHHCSDHCIPFQLHRTAVQFYTWSRSGEYCHAFLRWWVFWMHRTSEVLSKW